MKLLEPQNNVLTSSKKIAQPLFPEIKIDEENRYKPFPLTDIQESFYVGRILDPKTKETGAHIYLELTIKNLDLALFNSSLNTLIKNIDMLRTVINENGQQQTLARVSELNIHYRDLQHKSLEEKHEAIIQIRNNLSHFIYDSKQWPLFSIWVAQLEENNFHVFFSIDELIADGPSVALIFKYWQELYRNGTLNDLPTVAFRDYVLAIKAFEQSPLFKKSLKYWHEKLINMDKFLTYPLIINSNKNFSSQRKRSLLTLSKENWFNIKKLARRSKITTSVLLLTIFSQAISLANQTKNSFPIILTLYNRIPIHPDIAKIIGPFISTSIFLAQHSQEYLLPLVHENQQQLWNDLEHSYVSGIRALREHNLNQKQFIQVPIVFTSMLGALGKETLTSECDWVSQLNFKDSITQAPQVYLENILYEQDEQLYLYWDVAEDHVDIKKTRYAFFLLERALANLSRLNEINTSFSINQLFSYQPFSLTDVQAAYFVGRTKAYMAGDVSCQMYQEIEIQQLNVKRFEYCWNYLIMQHEQLRTVITYDGQQKIIPLLEDYKIQVHDLKNFNNENQQTQLISIRQQFQNKLFNLESWPMFDIAISLLSNKIIIHFSFDALIADAKSICLLFNQLFSLYEDPKFIIYKTAESFEDYVIAMKNQSNSQEGRLAKEYWRNKFVSMPPGPQFRSDILNLNEERLARAHYLERLENCHVLFNLANQLKIPVDIILLTCYAETLQSYALENEFTIVVVSWDRSQIAWPKINEIIGDFTCLNWIIIDTQFKNLSFLDKIQQVFSQFQADQTHQQVCGLNFLTQQMKINPKLNFPVVFTCLPDSNLNIRKSDFILGYGQSQTPQVFLDNILLLHNQELHIRWDGINDFFSPNTLEKMFETYITKLKKLDDRGEQEQSPHKNAEFDQLILWNNTKQTFIEHQNLGQLIERGLALNPHAVAVFFEDQTLSFLELSQRSNQLAHYLQQTYCKKNELVGVYMPRSIELVITLVAIIKAGMAYLPLDIEQPTERLKFMIEDSNVISILTLSNFEKQLLCNEDKIINIERKFDFIKQLPLIIPENNNGLDDIAYAIYTSGSTGQPKACLNTHRGICNRLLWMQDRFPLSYQDRVLQKTPYTFDVSVWEFFWPLISGAAIVLAKPGGHTHPQYLCKLIQEREVTTVHFVPSMLNLFLNEPNVYLCKSLKYFFVSGEALNAKLQEKFFEKLDCEFHNLYGPTEAAIDVTHWQCEKNWPHSYVPIGKPIANTQIYVLNDKKERVALGQEGELYIGGFNIARGYLNRDELTLERFVANPFSDRQLDTMYKTGDKAKFLPDGNIQFLGRLDNQIKLRGLRIELLEIENVILTYPDTQATAVVVTKDEEPKIIAFYTATYPLAAEDIIDYLNKKLPSYMVPNKFVQLDKLPITSNGKVDRTCLLNFECNTNKIITENMDGSGNQADLTNFIIQSCKEFLNLSELNEDDDLFLVGATSFTMIQLIQRLETVKKISITIEEFLKAPTIKQLVECIIKNSNEKEPNQEPSLKMDLHIALDKEKKQNFKNQQLGLREFPTNYPFIELMKQSTADSLTDNYLGSIREFSAALISCQDFSDLLTLLKEDSHIHKRRYPSAGGLYPVQTYIAIKSNRVAFIHGGLYYYHPQKHQLILMDKDFKIDKINHALYNRDCFEQSAFSLFFIANLEAIVPVYGEKLSREYVMLESGYMAQLLLQFSGNYHIGLCPIGDFDFDKIKEPFALSPNHILTHSLMGGLLTEDKKNICNLKLHKQEAILAEHDIAIIGISGKFPGANNLEEFWDILIKGKQSIQKFPEQRQKLVLDKEYFQDTWAGYINDVDKFDRHVFGISAEEASWMDPQERQLIQSIWETLEDSGYSHNYLSQHSNVGVFVGSMWSDYSHYGRELWQKNQKFYAFEQRSSLANRISFLFNFCGPSYVVDASCASALVAIHMACEEITTNKCDLAIAGGVNLILHPYHVEFLKHLKLLSQNQFSAALSDQATGWIPGEGVGTILLKSLKRAIEDKDHIYGIIKATDVMHVGKTSQFGYPNPIIQSQLIKKLMLRAKLNPSDLNYIEMAAAGSALADAAEFTALKEVFQNYSKQQYPIGTLKPNIGHLESASAMAQLSKIILQFKYNKIAPSLILGNINPFIHLDESPFYIPSKPIDLNNQKKQFNANHPQRALLNCYAGTGIYSSMIIENYPEQKFISPEQNFYLLPLSASTQEQLQEYAKKMLVFLENKDDYPLSDIAFSLQYGRQSMEKKVIFCCYNSKDFLYKLRVFFQTQENNSIRGIYHQKSSHSEILIQLGEDLASKVTLWLKGELNDWQQVEPYSNKQRLSLPTYPFIKESFWLFE